MDVRAVSTPRKMLAGFCAATLALAGCDDSSNKSNSDPSTATDGGNGNGNGNGNGPSDMDGGATGDDNSGTMEPPVAMLGDNVAGKACTGAADCEGENTSCASTIGGISILGMTIGGQTAEGGYCTGACQDDSSCGAGGVCVGAFNVMGFATQGSCQKACDTDAQCRESEGYACSDNSVTLPEGGIPGPDGGMGGGMVPMIPPQPSTCLPVPEAVDLEDGVVGKACTADADCAGGTCTTMIMSMGPTGPSSVTFPGGYCGGTCQEDENCGAGGVCIGAISFGPINLPGNCYQACEEQTDCTRTDGYACLETMGFMGPGPSACQPGLAPIETDAGTVIPLSN